MFGISRAQWTGHVDYLIALPWLWCLVSSSDWRAVSYPWTLCHCLWLREVALSLWQQHCMSHSQKVCKLECNNCSERNCRDWCRHSPGCHDYFGGMLHRKHLFSCVHWVSVFLSAIWCFGSSGLCINSHVKNHNSYQTNLPSCVLGHLFCRSIDNDILFSATSNSHWNVHSECRGGIATAPPLRRSYSDRAVTSPGGAFQTNTNLANHRHRTRLLADCQWRCRWWCGLGRLRNTRSLKPKQYHVTGES